MTLNITSGKQPLPPRILIYGPEKIGKSSIGASIPGAVFLPVETGLDAIDCQQLATPKNLDEVYKSIASLWEESHNFTTLVIDSLSAVEKLVNLDVIAQPNEAGKKVTSIEGHQFSKGRVMAAERFARLLLGLDHLRKVRKMTIVLLAHSQIAKVESPGADSYDRYQPLLHKYISPLVLQWVDLCVFANFQITVSDIEGSNRHKALGSGKRVAYFTEMPGHVAGTRYQHDDKGDFTWQSIKSGIDKSFNQPTQAETSTK